MAETKNYKPTKNEFHVSSHCISILYRFDMYISQNLINSLIVYWSDPRHKGTL